MEVNPITSWSAGIKAGSPKTGDTRRGITQDAKFHLRLGDWEFAGEEDLERSIGIAGVENYG